MARWHKSDCQTPEIYVKHEILHCNGCGSSPNIPELKKKNAATSSPPHIPQDEPLGQLALHWPLKKLYYSKSDDTESQPDVVVGKEGDMSQPPSGNSNNEKSGFRAPSHIYKETLGLSQLRLICLEPAEAGHPVHLTLETYNDDGCPEYETTSYMWGGENADNEFCCPVYVGRFWDVMFHTRNCHAMLKYLRPKRGIRLVWTDAVCINQKDTEERESQVAKMGEIYRRSTRAVVYLGADIIHDDGEGYPIRRGLNEVGDLIANRAAPNSPTLQQILSRKYFGRLWVIQELILSKSVTIRAGSVEYWADAGTMRLLDAANKSARLSPAPWVRDISRGKFDGDLLEVLKLTSKSQATDARDKVFGILSVTGEGGRSTIMPDYKISTQHVIVGTFSFLLLQAEKADVLLHSAGEVNWDRYPSWAPNWNSSNMFREPRESYDGIDGMRSATGLHVLVPVSAELKRSKSRYQQDPTSMDFIDEDIPQLQLRQKRPWHQGWRVSTSGILSINATFILTLRSVPIFDQVHHNIYIFRQESCNSTLFLGAEDPSLPRKIIPDDKIYAVDGGTPNCVFMILRREPGSRYFRLVFSLPKLWFGWSTVITSTPRYGRTPYEMAKLGKSLKIPKAFFLEDLQNPSLYSILESLQPSDSKNRTLHSVSIHTTRFGTTVGQIFPSLSWVEQLSVLRTLLHDEPRSSNPDFTKEYLRVMHKFHPSSYLQGTREYIQLTLEPTSEHYESAIKLYFPRQTNISLDDLKLAKFKSISRDATYVLSTELDYPFQEWKFGNGEWNGRGDFLDPSLKPRLFVRGMASIIRDELKKTREAEVMRQLAIARDVTLEDEISMLSRAPKLEDASVSVSPSWPKEIVSNFGIGGSTSLIEIE
ncbi:hypothetical protein DL764_005834 [Monosporascus ibericus]|uniref:Heterokaryon incompatibility domain-containing protein n=1 Tax=Monosporascus ibericus TaxID=155417 RepID=A0A4Q4T992_9PEZI|nr:hypothetical protein DL764_005834 [Monosporascus ibericus]